MITTRPRTTYAERAEPGYHEHDAWLYAPLGACAPLVIALLALGWPTAGALTAVFGCIYLAAIVALAWPRPR